MKHRQDEGFPWHRIHDPCFRDETVCSGCSLQQRGEFQYLNNQNIEAFIPLLGHALSGSEGLCLTRETIGM